MQNDIITQRRRIKSMKRVRKRKRRKRIFNTLLFIFFIILVSHIVKIYLKSHDYINLSNSQIKLYIDAADDASKEKLQVNWKYLAAIDGIRYNRNFSKSNKENIKELANTFLIKTSTSNSNNNIDNYKLLNMDNILNQLSFNEKDKEKAYKYLNQLEFIGLVPGNLRKDSSCRKFVEELTPKAIEIYNKYSILPSITISQSILESGWGKSNLSIKANNLFGIKADSRWNGKSINMSTSEHYDEVINANFRMYKNKTDSLDDYAKFLFNNERYERFGLFNASQYIAQAQALENAGYSTRKDSNGDKIYADLLIDIIRQNNLQLIDNMVQTEKE